jgi:NADH-quinone oxidoreductase subunit J
MTELLWWIFASLAIGGGIGMVTRKSPVASLLFLVVTFFSLAAIYVILEAHFIAAIQVIVYAGAIMVLFLFVIMLLNLGHDYQADLRGGVWLLAGFVAAGLMGYFLSRSVVGEARLAVWPDEPVFGDALRESGAVGAIAFPLFRDYVVPFELTAILLLVAVIGAVVLAKRSV